MNRKYIFLDLDGTIIDHATHEVPKSAMLAMQKARENGHELILTTGRPPALLYGIDKELGFHSIIAANGRIVIYHDEILFESPIPEKTIDELVVLARDMKIDIAYEGLDGFVLESKYDTIYPKFCNNFNLQLPDFEPGYYKGKHIYQITMFYEQPDFEKFREMVPSLAFELSCPYGLDVNTPGGLKEVGIKVFKENLGLSMDDIIAIGDGFNDISMLQYVDQSVAMGNAHDSVKKHAKYVTDNIDNDGLYKAFKRFNLI